MVDNFGFTSALEPFLAVFILIILMIIMLFLYIKVRVFLLILLVFLFSIIIGIYSIAITTIPFNPYISIFFILFQGSVFLKFSLEVYL